MRLLLLSVFFSYAKPTLCVVVIMFGNRRSRPVWRMFAVTTRDFPIGSIEPCQLCGVYPLDFLPDGDVSPNTSYACIVLVPFSAGTSVSMLFDDVLASCRPYACQQISHVWEVENG